MSINRLRSAFLGLSSFYAEQKREEWMPGITTNTMNRTTEQMQSERGRVCE